MGRMSLRAAIPLLAVLPWVGALSGAAGLAHPTPGCRTLAWETRADAVPVAPGPEEWYDRLDDPATPAVNEAARDIARALDPRGGSLRQHTYDWLGRGGRMIIIVGGTIDEDTNGEWMPPAREWMRGLALRQLGCSVVPILQINYRLTGIFGLVETLANPVAYAQSFEKGLRRAKKMIWKAASAGSREIWVLGLSKGADIAGNAVGDLAWLAPLKRGILFAVPYVGVGGVGIRSAVAPPEDPTWRRAGLFKYGVQNGRNFRGKLIVFNKKSDHIANDIDPWAVWALFGPGHHYERVVGASAFRRRIEALMADPHAGYVDRAAGSEFDF